MKAFDSRRENAFDLKHVHTCHCLEELAKLPSPKVVIATSSDLSNGFSADLLPSLLSQPRGLLLLTRRAALGSVAGQLGATPSPTTYVVHAAVMNAGCTTVTALSH